MKNLLVPAAIAICGLLITGQSLVTNCTNSVDTSNSKHDKAKNHRHFRNQEVTATEVPVNAVKVASFASITETIMPSFFIDFSDGQTAVSDIEINNQMQENLVVISLQDASTGDIEIIEQMQKSLLKIETPVLQNADEFIVRQFAQEQANTLKFVTDEETNVADNEIHELFENGKY